MISSWPAAKIVLRTDGSTLLKSTRERSTPATAAKAGKIWRGAEPGASARVLPSRSFGVVMFRSS